MERKKFWEKRKIDLDKMERGRQKEGEWRISEEGIKVIERKERWRKIRDSKYNSSMKESKGWEYRNI